MNATAPPPKPALILATPINVEESRAQRFQRQQARFRDRGGIFVPTNRSTLLDILLGKASPLKKPRRSASASPSRVIAEKSSVPNEISEPTLRRSPRKQSQKKVDVVTDEQPPGDPESQVGKPVKKASSSKKMSAAVRSSSQLKPTKKAEPIYSDLSEDKTACKPTKKASTKKVKKAAAPLKKVKSKTSSAQKGKGASGVKEAALCQLPNIPEEDEEKEDTVPAPPASPSNPVVISSKGKKRGSTSITQDSDSRRKRIKTIQPDIEPSVHKKSHSSDEALLVTSKKRRRNPGDSESGVEDGANKRKKRSGRSESKVNPEIPVEEDNVKPTVRKSNKAKVTKQAGKSKNQCSDNTTNVSTRKENSSRSKPPQGKVTSKSGPPKSVLQRIKDSLGAQVVDNEPDPIDFLS